MQYALTRNEAKILRAMNDYGEAFLYELASAAQLTPSDVTEAARLLAKRELAVYYEDKSYLRITKEGEAARRTLLRSSAKFSPPRSASSVSIVSDEEESAVSSFDEMNEAELDAALNEEIDKLKE